MLPGATTASKYTPEALKDAVPRGLPLYPATVTAPVPPLARTAVLGVLDPAPPAVAGTFELELLPLLVPVTVTPVGATTKTKDALAVSAGLELSLAWTVKSLVPEAVGVPLIAPVEASRLNPAGRLPPLIDHVYGAVPPVPETVAV